MSGSRRCYRVADTGLHHALFLTRAHNRILRAGLAELNDPNPPSPARLRAATRNYQAAIDNLAQRSGLTA